MYLQFTAKDISNSYQNSFWRKVNQSGRCWIWLGTVLPSGYGRFMVKGVGYLMAHRVSFTLCKHPILPTLALHHICRNRQCVNPDHMEPMTLSENTHRGRSVSVVNGKKTHCLNGHKFTKETTRLKRKRNGLISRECRVCDRARHRRLSLADRGDGNFQG